MSNTAKFISGDGVEHEVNADSVAFGLMSKDGSFQRVAESAADGSKAPLKRPELIALAKSLGIEFKANTKNVDLLAALEAAQKTPEA
jgi:hypothetical protein